MHFSELRLIEPILRAVEAEGYSTPTPIQQKAIPHLLQGRDLVGVARTGTGKTAAFALPLLQRLAAAPPKTGHARPLRLLVLTPTRELAAQVGESFANYGKHLHLKHAVIFGGVGQDPQVKALRAGVDILVATPGRLLDLIEQGHARLDQVEYFVLDEADRMLDMGFIHDVRRVVAKVPKKRQTLLLSATMPDEIRALAASILIDPVHVEATPVSSTADKIEQSVWFVPKAGKRRLLAQLLGDPAVARALVFTRTKHGANRVAEQLEKDGVVAAAIHGNKSQGARERALAGFKDGRVRVLVATDIAARGLDIDDVTHVFNFDLPEVPEQYVHRIGRTARAGASGIAIAFCDDEERALLADIEKLIKQRVRVAGEVARGSVEASEPARSSNSPSQAPRREHAGDEARSEGGRRRRGGRGGGGKQAGSDANASQPRRAGNNGRRDGGRSSGGGNSRGGGGNNRPRRGPSLEQVLDFWNR